MMVFNPSTVDASFADIESARLNVMFRSSRPVLLDVNRAAKTPAG